MRRPKILICAFDTSEYHGGPNVWLKRILPIWKEHLDVSIAFFIAGRPELAETYTLAKRIGITCYVARYMDSIYDNINFLQGILARHSFDVFIPQHMLAGFYSVPYATHKGIPSIAVIHSLDNCYHKASENFILSGTEYQVSAAVVVSDYLRQIISKETDKIPIVSIPCGVPTQQDELPKQHFFSDSIKVAYAGRLEIEQKQIIETVKAFCLTAKKLPNVAFSIFGKGSEEENIRRIVSENGLTNRIEIKYSPSELLLDELKKHHIFVLLSDYEGFPIALMEAMSVGLVPICYDKILSGVPEAVIHGETGFLVPDRLGSFVASVENLVNNRDLLYSMSQKAKHRIESEFSIEATANKWINFITEVAQIQIQPSTRPFVRPPLPAYDPVFAQQDLREPTWLLRLKQYSSYYTYRLRKLLGV